VAVLKAQEITLKKLPCRRVGSLRPRRPPGDWRMSANHRLCWRTQRESGLAAQRISVSPL